MRRMSLISSARNGYSLVCVACMAPPRLMSPAVSSGQAGSSSSRSTRRTSNGTPSSVEGDGDAAGRVVGLVLDDRQGLHLRLLSGTYGSIPKTAAGP